MLGSCREPAPPPPRCAVAGLCIVLGFLLCAAPMAAGSAHPQDAIRNRTVPAVRVDSPPVIDGILDDPCWSTLPEVSGFTDEALGTPVADDTIVRIGYDDVAIYVAFRCLDSRPEQIVARERKRGVRFRGEDRVRIYLNPFNNKRWEDESMLDVNPLGTQFARFAGGRAGKLEWEGAWQSAARVDENGWTVEVAVPWADFARPPADGKPRNLGINFERYQARTQTRSYWSNLGPQARVEYSGEWVGVVLPPESGVQRLSLLAYAFGGVSEGDVVKQAGVDARYRFTPLQTGVVSLNPDFSDVEGAVTSVDFSYSEVIADESRPFFLEGAAYYRTADYRTNSFYPIRIPAFDFGAKFYGKTNGTDIGLLATHRFDGRTDAVVNLVSRTNPFDSYGLQVVGLDGDGQRNLVVQGTARIRRGDWSFSGAYAMSDDLTGPGESARIGVFWVPERWFVGASYALTSPGYLPRNGYVPFTDERGVSLSAGYNGDWRSGPIRSIEWSLDANRFERYDGSLFRQGVTSSVELRTNDLSIYAHLLASRFEDNDDLVAAIGFGYPALDRFRNVGIGIRQGRLAGLDYLAITPSVKWQFGGRLNVSLTSEWVRIGGTRRQDVLGVAYDFAPDRGIGGRLVRRDSSVNWYLSYRKSGYGGLEMFVILGDPNADNFAERLVFKVVQEF
ncbi:MAG: hypothetical protein AMXMBFR61_11800 [Fimbriimonadales bacterium]